MDLSFKRIKDNIRKAFQDILVEFTFLLLSYELDSAEHLKFIGNLRDWCANKLAIRKYMNGRKD